MGSKMDIYLKEKLKRIKLLAMDVDGILTDGGLYYHENGNISKKFNVKDGMGIALFKRKGYKVAFITGQVNKSVEFRAQKLGIDKLVPGARKKDEVLINIMEEFGLISDEIAYMGDDINDLPAFKVAGVKITVNDAFPYIKDYVDIVTKRRGGDGAVREVIDLILQAKGEFDFEKQTDL